MAAAVEMSERQLQDAIVESARLQGWMVFHMHDSRRAGWGTDSAGFPDLVMVRKGRLLFAELKTRTGVLSIAQKAWLTALFALETVETYVWRPADWLSGSVEKALSGR